MDDDSDQSSDDEIVEGEFVITKEDSKKARSPSLLSLHCTHRCPGDEGYEGIFLRKSADTHRVWETLTRSM